MSIDRRDFLKGAGLLAGSTALPLAWPEWATGSGPSRALELTTLGRTIVKGAKLGEGSAGAYFRLAEGAGERHIVREELAKRGANWSKRVRSGRRSLFNFAHFTDIHLIDAQSPARVEFLDRFGDPGRGCESIPFQSAFRPQETLTLQVLESMIRQIRRISVSPVTGRPISLVVCTGDNTDNEQLNEIRWFVDLMDGRKTVSGNSGGGEYEGVQSGEWGDPEYWHPDPEVPDKYKQQFGFPEYPGLLDAAIKPFRATGIGLPWFQTFGNHDGLMQGNAPRNPVFDRVAVGGLKFTALPPGVNPCDAFETLRSNPTAFASAPMRPVTPDESRQVATRRRYVEEMFNTTGTPVGHGLTPAERDQGVAYWVNDKTPGFRLIGLDTVNPGGYDDGSIGARQFAWLEERLRERSSRYFDSQGNEVSNDAPDRYIILFSHHGLRSLDNPFQVPDPFEPSSNDMPRMLREQVEALVLRYPNVIAWVNGHTHENIVEPHVSESGSGFWDIGTAAHIDWSCQSRLVEVVDNHDGTLSIFCTMVDHAAPVVPSGKDEVLRLASIHRELAANDFQKGFEYKGPGKPEDRNVELLVKAPFRAPTRTIPRKRPAALVG